MAVRVKWAMTMTNTSRMGIRDAQVKDRMPGADWSEPPPFMLAALCAMVRNDIEKEESVCMGFISRVARRSLQTKLRRATRKNEMDLAWLASGGSFEDSS